MNKSINDTSLFTKKNFISVVTINFNNDKGLGKNYRFCKGTNK